MADDRVFQEHVQIPVRVGRYLVVCSRRAVQTWLTEGRKIAPAYPYPECRESRGVFVTITRQGDLRGCIGFPWPVYPLEEGVIEAAIAAAIQDPRFPPVTPDELPDLRFEVSVLTQPQRVARDRVQTDVVIGRDGLIIAYGHRRGLLLPQVAARFGWDVRAFLAHTCIKAGLPEDAWQWPDARIWTFQTQIFHEGEEGS